MRERVVVQYSACFKRQVIAELERGRFASVQQARIHYGIGGSQTIANWLSRYGRNALRAKVVRVEQVDEADRIRQLQKQVADLERALGQTQAQSVLHAQYLKLACQELGVDEGSFKKKCDGGQCTPRPAARD